jgi:carbamoyl-phosphate synthase large subunit
MNIEMVKKYKILVSGCGGDIGQSIGKILHNYSDEYELFGIDISDKNAGKFIFQNFTIGIPISDSNFLDFIINYISINNIDIYIPIAEPELRFFAEKGICDNIGKSILLTANLKALNVGFDKLRTVEFLKKALLPFPETYSAENENNTLPFPFILKSRTGSGSKKIYKIENEEDRTYLAKKNNFTNFIIQSLLPNDNEEYTCGLFRSKKGETRSIIFRRELTGGYSGYGELSESKEIKLLLDKIAFEINLIGSINIQLRMHKNQPVVFEINPRFSSTVFFRNLFGFNDLIWSIQDARNIPISGYTRSTDFKFFYKGFAEYIS